MTHARDRRTDRAHLLAQLGLDAPVADYWSVRGARRPTTIRSPVRIANGFGLPTPAVFWYSPTSFGPPRVGQIARLRRPGERTSGSIRNVDREIGRAEGLGKLVHLDRYG